MLLDLFFLLLEVAVTLLGGACLLRLYMNWRGLPAANPLGRLVLALTNWMVLPLRRVLPARGRLDVASLAAAWFLKLLQYLLVLALTVRTGWALLPVLALLGVARLAVSLAMVLVIVTALLSWLGGHTPQRAWLEQLCAPLLAPLRKRMPLVGGVDLSPAVAVLLLFVLGWVLERLLLQLLGTALIPVGV